MGARLNWPKDTLEIINAMRADRYKWREIAERFGCQTNTLHNKWRTLEAKSAIQRSGSLPDNVWFYSEADDIEIRRAYLAQESMWDCAARIGRSRESIYQRILRKHPDLLNTVRGTGEIQRTIFKYGNEFLKIKKDPKEALAQFQWNRKAAKDRARKAVEFAKQKRTNYLLDMMDDEIALGKDRNDAIFSARAAGLSLQAIGDHFGITRERVRQIFEKTASDRALGAEATNLAAQVGDGSETIRDSDGKPITNDTRTIEGYVKPGKVTDPFS